jgi:hypothetical protein
MKEWPCREGPTAAIDKNKKKNIGFVLSHVC